MKKQSYLLMAAFVLTAASGFAQDKKTETVPFRLRYENTHQGRHEVIERTFDTQKQLDGFLDSLNKKAPANAQTSIRIRTGSGNRPDPAIGRNYEFFAQIPRQREDLKKQAEGFRWQAEGSARRMERWAERLADDVTRDLDLRNWEFPNLSSLGTAEPADMGRVRALSIFPNKPFNKVLNVRFNTARKGDVTIRVIDTSGRQVAEQTLRDHEGEYIGQVELKNARAGTYFVTVTQGDDGSVKRVVVP